VLSAPTTCYGLNLIIKFICVVVLSDSWWKVSMAGGGGEWQQKGALLASGMRWIAKIIRQCGRAREVLVSASNSVAIREGLSSSFQLPV